MSESLKDIINPKNVMEQYTPEMQRKIKGMAMPVSEIVNRFEKTEGKAKDLQILAELNGCSRNDIQIIIETELGTEVLPKQMTKLTTTKKAPAPVPAKQPKKKVQEKVKVNHYAMQAVQIALEQVDDQLKELESQIAVLQQQEDELKTAYNAYVQFMEDFEEE
ncbi:MAG: hypothetical protein K6G85_03850 [Eubacterium sp.]|nr:hypothetical protein [Eubacterium sp.]